MYLERIKISFNLTIRKQPSRKIGKRFEQKFHRRRYASDKVHEKILHVIGY